MLLFCVLASLNAYGQSPAKWVGFFDREGFIESAPALSADGKRLVFVAYPTGDPALRQMYESKRMPDGHWSQPFPVSSVNQAAGRGSELGGCFLSYDGNYLYFHARMEDSRGGTDLYYVKRKSFGWGEPVNLGDTINSTGDEKHPSLSPDGRELYFEQTLVFKDIYFVQQPKVVVSLRTREMTWSAPLRLLPLLKLAAAEAPLILADGKSLLFSASSGSGADYGLYMSQRHRQGWQEPVLLPLGISGKEPVLCTVTAGMDSLFFSSQQGMQRSVLNSPFNLSPLHALSVDIREYISDNPGRAEVNILANSGSSYPIHTYSNEEDGRLLALLPADDAYEVVVSKKGFEPEYFQFDPGRSANAITYQSFALLPESVDIYFSFTDLITKDTLQAEVLLTDSLSRTIKVAYDSLTSFYTASLKMKKPYRLKVKAENYADFEQLLRVDSLSSSTRLNIPLALKRSFYDFSFRITDAIYEFVPEDVSFNIVNLTSELDLYPVYDADQEAFLVELDNGTRYRVEVNAYGYEKYETVLDAEALINNRDFEQQIRLKKISQ